MKINLLICMVLFCCMEGNAQNSSYDSVLAEIGWFGEEVEQICSASKVETFRTEFRNEVVIDLSIMEESYVWKNLGLVGAKVECAAVYKEEVINYDNGNLEIWKEVHFADAYDILSSILCFFTLE